MRLTRVDGLDKVRGSKVYGSDFRARDMGWGDSTLHALLVRAPVGNHLLEAIDVTRFPEGIRPRLLITADDLAAKGVASNLDRAKKPGNPPSKPELVEHWLLPLGRVSRFAGQPVAIAYYDETSVLADAAHWLRGGNSPAVMRPAGLPGAEADIRRLAGPLLAMVERKEVERYSTTSYVRRAGAPTDVFSHMENGRHDPFRVSEATEPKARAVNRLARATWQDIEREIAESDWHILERTFYTPTHDPMFMETEAGLARYLPDERRLQLVVGTQSPSKDRSNIRDMLWGDKTSFGAVTVELIPRFPGGGFGGRDDSTFSVYLALAALFAAGPVRLAYDRYEQFGCGIKRHASVVRNRLAYDGQGGLQAIVSTIVMDGGGEANLTGAVTGLAALHAAGPYRLPRAVVNGVGIVTPGAPAGSMRGFGIPQVTLAIECMIDEIAADRHLDPLELRRSNLLLRGDRDLTGMTLRHHLANDAIVALAAAEPLWQQREAQKRERSRDGEIAYGVGFAMCMQAFGTTSDAALASVRLGADGRITVYSSAVDMGQGSATAVALAPLEILGRVAEAVEMGQDAYFDDLRPATKRVNAMSASMTAFHKVHAVQQASQVLWHETLAPLAAELTGVPVTSAMWRDGALRVGDRVLSLAELAALAHERGRVTEAMVHTYYQDRFAVTEYRIGAAAQRFEIDTLAVRRGAGELSRVEGTVIDQPNNDDEKAKRTRRTLYASAGHLVGIEVRLRSGQIAVREAVTLLDAGAVHHAPMLEGQVEGGLAMGIGMALLEELPPSPEGTDGRWNLHRYQVARARHMPLASVRQLRLVPFTDASILADGGGVAKKGVAEAVMTTVAPAILNAFAHATGLRVNRVPLTPARVLEALRQK